MWRIFIPVCSAIAVGLFFAPWFDNALKITDPALGADNPFLEGDIVFQQSGLQALTRDVSTAGVFAAMEKMAGGGGAPPKLRDTALFLWGYVPALGLALILGILLPVGTVVRRVLLLLFTGMAIAAVIGQIAVGFPFEGASEVMSLRTQLGEKGQFLFFEVQFTPWFIASMAFACLAVVFAFAEMVNGNPGKRVDNIEFVPVIK